MGGDAMTIEQALEQTKSLLDQHVAKCVSDYETILRNHGATDDELADELAHMRAECIKEKERTLSRVRAWLNVCRLEHDIDEFKKELDVTRAEFDRGEAMLQ
jgi:hypothetical protein